MVAADFALDFAADNCKQTRVQEAKKRKRDADIREQLSIG
jgi:hypothetical protein